MEYHTHSENPEQTLKKFFVIGPIGAAMLFALSSFLLLILNSKAIWGLLHGDLGTGDLSAQTALDQRFTPISRILDGAVFDRLGLLLFWALIGCIAYMVFWLLQYALISAREDYVEGHYIHPRSFSTKTYWRTVAARRIFLVSTMFVFGGYALFMAKSGLPVLSRLFFVGLNNIPVASSFVNIFSAVAITGFSLYVGFLLWKLLKGVWGLAQVPE